MNEDMKIMLRKIDRPISPRPVHPGSDLLKEAFGLGYVECVKWWQVPFVKAPIRLTKKGKKELYDGKS